MTGICRRLAFNANIIGLLALILLPSVRAYCYIDNNNVERCTNNLSPGVRIAIGVVIALFFLFIMAMLEFTRRRRAQRANMMYINQPPPQQTNYGYGPGYPQATPPQYPPQTYGSPYHYDASTGFAPPQGPPPPQYSGNYAPPDGPPPAKQ